MDPTLQALCIIVERSAKQITQSNPNGYCYMEPSYENHIGNLSNAGMIEAQLSAASRGADNSIPVRPTDRGVEIAHNVAKQSMAQQGPAFMQAPATRPLAFGEQTTQQRGPQHPAPQAPSQLTIEADIPIPEKKAFGRTTAGNNKVTQYGFANMPINASFFVPQPPGDEKQIHRTFSSVVSQANKALHPMNFVIRYWKQPDGTEGARVWRVEDMTGPRPVRAPKPAAPGFPQHMAPPPPLPGFLQGPSPGQPFGATAGAPSFPGGFAAPGNPSFGNGPSFATEASEGNWGGVPNFGSPPLSDADE